MRALHGPSLHRELDKALQIDCAHCCGLCCVALYCFRSDGFPADKPVGKPCRCLQEDFRCRIHKDLSGKGMRGCLAFDCMGAGQRLTAGQYAGGSWRSHPEMPDVFHVVCQLHQMLWYLSEAVTLLPAQKLWPVLETHLDETSRLAVLPPEGLLALDLESQRGQVNPVLKRAAELTMAAAGTGRSGKPLGPDLIGRRFRGDALRGADLSTALLIAANLSGCSLYGTNLLGADLRDTDLRGADLSESLFLTQAQINSAKGSVQTKLPPRLSRPKSWE